MPAVEKRPLEKNLTIYQEIEGGIWEIRLIFRDEARKKFKESVNAYDAAKSVALGVYKGWNERERIVGNVERAYSEFEGEPPGVDLPDLLDIMVRMMEYRGELEGQS